MPAGWRLVTPEIIWADARSVRPDYQIARLLIERGLGILYLIAFVVALEQFPALCGERGLQPAPRLLARCRSARAEPVPLGLLGPAAADRAVDRRRRWRRCSSLGLPQRGAAARSRCSPGSCSGSSTSRSSTSAARSTASAGSRCCSRRASSRSSSATTRSRRRGWSSWPFRWLAFRVEFGAGLIKLRGDRCWRELRCMDFHHETQPMPNPLSWFFHRLPRPLHRLEAIGNFVAQLVAAVRPVPAAAVRVDRRARS